MLATLLQSSRLPFLILTPACVMVGIAMSQHSQADLDAVAVTLILIAAVTAHISVNALNEYEDFKTGLDLKTVRTPFSGGSGALPQNPDAATAVLGLGIATLLICVGIGIYFLLQIGWPVLLIGIPGCLLIVAYTRWINRLPLLCLVSPGFAFGPLMICGSYLALTGSITPAAAWASLPTFFLVNNLLLLNQYPDIEADRSIGRNHFPIRFGTQAATRAYLLFLLAAIVILIEAIALGHLPQLALISLLPMLPAFASFNAMRSYGEKIAEAPQFMAINVSVAIFHPLLLAASIFIS